MTAAIKLSNTNRLRYVSIYCYLRLLNMTKTHTLAVHVFSCFRELMRNGWQRNSV